ncbi:hypothetical protein HD806DRAFT_492676 [Xylariaceae sp. AK1471]|nr:hypothetical protein HD806DRAFT_492676 [Xylariaceae sp. AK1471]
MLDPVFLAPSCLSETWVSSGADGSTPLVLGNPSDTSCWPGNRNPHTTFSSTICPPGYRSACDGKPTDRQQTVWACCPNGFDCDGGTFSCILHGHTKDINTITVNDYDRLGNRIMTQHTGDEVEAHPITIAFYSSDIKIPTTSSPLSTTTSPKMTSSLSMPTSSTIPANASRILTTGASIGIGVVIGVTALSIVLAVGWWVRRQHRRKNTMVNAAEEVAHPHCREVPPLTGATLCEVNGSPDLFELGTEEVNKRTTEKLVGGVRP